MLVTFLGLPLVVHDVRVGTCL